MQRKDSKKTVSFLSDERLEEEMAKTNLIVEMIAEGDFDNDIIKAYRSMKVDLSKSTTGANWKGKDSSYRKLAREIGLNTNDDLIIRSLYAAVMFNKRFIRDRVMQRTMSIEEDQVIKVNLIEISQAHRPNELPSRKDERKSPKNKTPPSSNLPKSNEVPYVKGPQPLRQVKYVNWSKVSEEHLCPRCNVFGKTKIQHKIGLYAWLWALGLGCSGIFLSCFWFPFVLSCSKDTLHICTNCQFILGKVPPISLTKHLIGCPTSTGWMKNILKTPKMLMDKVVVKKTATK